MNTPSRRRGSTPRRNASSRPRARGPTLWKNGSGSLLDTGELFQALRQKGGVDLRLLSQSPARHFAVVVPWVHHRPGRQRHQHVVETVEELRGRAAGEVRPSAVPDEEGVSG